MNEGALKIDNPVKTINHSAGWLDYKKHALVVVRKFPAEYKIVQDDEMILTVLNIPLSAQGKAIAKDQLIYLRPEESGTGIELSITNENGRIESYTELERDKASLEVFTKLVNKSINGTLNDAIQNVQKPKVNTGNAVIQLIILIVAIIAIIMGLKAFI